MPHQGSWGPGSGMPYALFACISLSFLFFPLGMDTSMEQIPLLRRIIYAPIHTFLRDIPSILELLIT